MIIHSHILSWNEGKILPFILDYHSKISSKIFVYDNMSTDNSDEIYKKYEKVEVVKWSSEETFNDYYNMQIKSNCYKDKSRGIGVDWVIVCDCDEILYHENLFDVLSKYKSMGIDIPKINGHDMVSNVFPEYNGQLITEIIKTGSDVYEPMCKNIIFNPEKDVSFGAGAHASYCLDCVKNDTAELKLLHYKFLGKDYVKRIYISRAKRLSEFNKLNKFGEHYFNLPFEYMDKMLKENKKII